MSNLTDNFPLAVQLHGVTQIGGVPVENARRNGLRIRTPADAVTVDDRAGVRVVVTIESGNQTYTIRAHSAKIYTTTDE